MFLKFICLHFAGPLGAPGQLKIRHQSAIWTSFPSRARFVTDVCAQVFKQTRLDHSTSCDCCSINCSNDPLHPVMSNNPERVAFSHEEDQASTTELLDKIICGSTWILPASTLSSQLPRIREQSLLCTDNDAAVAKCISVPT